MDRYAPVVLFVYNRPQHTLRTLQALEKNTLAPESDLYVFSDGAKSPKDMDNVQAVRNIIARKWGFKQVQLIERKRNWGLAANIIDGVSSIIKQYGNIIVLEDDLETSPYALQYFNDALQRYQDEDRVMHISGYMYPLKSRENLPECFFFRVPSSWGWATWQRAWDQFNPDIADLTKDFDATDITRFSIDRTENFWKQVCDFKAGKINSWAIRWYLSIFRQGGLALYPRDSMVQNIGTDGSGTHSDAEKVYRVDLAQRWSGNFPDEIIEHQDAYEAIKYFYKHRKGSWFARGSRFLGKKWYKLFGK